MHQMDCFYSSLFVFDKIIHGFMWNNTFFLFKTAFEFQSSVVINKWQKIIKMIQAEMG